MMNRQPYTRFSAAFALSVLGIPCLAGASDASSNPAASVPAITYQSVFRNTSLGIEADKTDWRKANEEVGKFTRGHVDILKQEEIERAGAGSPALPPKPAAATQPHRHHH